jgi:hypothetical protein
MQSYTSVPAPTPYELPYTKTALLHPDGAFFCLLCVASWILFLWIWAWNHKPRKGGKLSPRASKWKMPSNWRN